MHLEDFWALVETARRQTPDPAERVVRLTAELARRPSADIVGFQLCHDRLRELSDTWPMWAAGHQIMDGYCSGDGFWYFQAWLIGLGRRAFDRAAADPDTLAEAPELLRLAGRPLDDWSDAEFPEWESFNYAARRAYDRATGEEEGLDDALTARGHDSPADPDPTGERWNFDDPAEMAARLPRLSRLFPRSDPADRARSQREAFDAPLAERGQTEAQFRADLGAGLS